MLCVQTRLFVWQNLWFSVSLTSLPCPSVLASGFWWSAAVQATCRNCNILPSYHAYMPTYVPNKPLALASLPGSFRGVCELHSWQTSGRLHPRFYSARQSCRLACGECKESVGLKLPRMLLGWACAFAFIESQVCGS